ncbi:MAG: UvrD-helicase domain-containing protein [Armatimonadetes bacterium]|nr:UvrD-helicase domain-containing protein [Armatimonadota bacterium]
MTPPRISRGIASRIFYGPGSAELNDAGVSISSRGDSESFPVGELSGLLAREDGPIWSTVRVPTARGERSLRGLPKTRVGDLVQAANAAVAENAAGRYAYLEPILDDLIRRTEDLAAAPRYIRHSEVQPLLDELHSALAIRSDALWREYAPMSQKVKIGRLTLLAEGEGGVEGWLGSLNGTFMERELATYADFFDSIERKPFTAAQRRACVVAEDNNLVLAGAGTGKTSVMIGRAGYLIASDRAKPEEILMLAYGRKAAEEMQGRQDSRLAEWITGSTPTIKTFHALGLEIIGKAEGKRPDLTVMAEDGLRFTQFIDETIASQCEEDEYRQRLVRYCGTERFPYRNWFDFTSEVEYLEYVRTNELRTLKGEVVKSFEEVFIANYLASQGVRYAYEHPYEVDTAGPDYRQYHPDFYLPDHGVYIEHFGLDRSGMPPEYFDQQKYLEGVAWKRVLHAEHGTRLIQTYSYLKREDLLESTLEAELRAAGVEFNPQSAEELLAQLRETSQVTDFAMLVGNFISLMKQSGLSFQELRMKAAVSIDASHINLLLDLIAPVYLTYEATLAERGEIDFADMISRATEHVESGRYQSLYTHIMVDEFQDISPMRARLVQALLRQRPEAMLFAVGDDWQSIYRFTGSDLRYTTRFAEIFGATAVKALDLTFRFNDKLGEVASTFVLKNPVQVRKELGSLRAQDEPAVSLVASSSTRTGLDAALEAISLRADGTPQNRSTVLVLGRFSFTHTEVDNAEYRSRVRRLHPGLDVRFMTAHGSKGREADYVVILDVSQGRYGFPSERPTEPAIEFLLPQAEPFRFAEERRLFYVALTRARHRIYVVYDPTRPSSFVTELLDAEGPYQVDTGECSDSSVTVTAPPECPRCKAGRLVAKTGEYGNFVACSHFPYCDYREASCPKCGGVMRRESAERVCLDAECDMRVRICPWCGGNLVTRTGRWGPFIGCSNYGRNGHSCTYKEKA